MVGVGSGQTCVGGKACREVSGLIPLVSLLHCHFWSGTSSSLCPAGAPRKSKHERLSFFFLSSHLPLAGSSLKGTVLGIRSSSPISFQAAGIIQTKCAKHLSTSYKETDTWCNNTCIKCFASDAAAIIIHSSFSSTCIGFRAEISSQRPAPPITDSL